MTVSAWRRWRATAITSVVDQGVGSGGQFLFSVVLARWLPPAEYGTYALVFSYFLLLAGFQSAIVVEPMNVLGPSRYRTRLRSYLATVVRANLVVTSGLALVCLLLARAVKPMWGISSEVLLGLAVLIPTMLLLWSCRQACYVLRKPQLGLQSSVVYALGLVAALAVLHAMGREAPRAWLNAFGGMAVAALAASLIVWPEVGRLHSDESPQGFPVDHQTIVRQHWCYGRWILVASAADWIGTGIYLPIVAGLLGLTASGGLRAMQNLILPLQQVVAGIGLLLLPWMAGEVVRRGAVPFLNTTARLVLLHAGLAGAYGLVLLAGQDHLIRLVYGHGYYDGLRWIVPLLVGGAIVKAATQPLALAVRAVQWPAAVLAGKLATVAILLVAGLPLVRRLGVGGAACGLMLGNLGEMTVLAYHMLRVRGRWAMIQRV